MWRRLYAIDMGFLFLILAYFTNELVKEEKRLIPKELLRSYRIQRDATVVSSALFFVSILPPFWSFAILGIPLRFVLWMSTFLVWMARRSAEARMRRQAALTAGVAQVPRHAANPSQHLGSNRSRSTSEGVSPL